MTMQNERPHILVTNDDGIHAEGLETLTAALEPDYDLTIVAPHRERSATGHAITVLRDLRLESIDREGKHWGWSFEGRPADCVKMAVSFISRDRPFDLVVSGINRGQNLGINVLYSGTVAAAREATLLGIPAIAFSLAFDDPEDVRFDTAGKVAVEMTRRVLRHGLPPDVALNVNIPPIDFSEIKGYAVTRQGRSAYLDRFEEIEQGRIFKNIGDKFRQSPRDDHDLDDRAVRNKFVSLTPLQIDQTAYRHLNDMQALLED